MILLLGSAEEQPREGGNNHKLMTVLSLAPIAPLTVINHEKWFLEGGDRIEATFQKPNPGHSLETAPPYQVTRGVVCTKHNARSYRALLNGASVVLSLEDWTV